jgi:hypothetical protein
MAPIPKRSALRSRRSSVVLQSMTVHAGGRTTTRSCPVTKSACSVRCSSPSNQRSAKCAGASGRRFARPTIGTWRPTGRGRLLPMSMRSQLGLREQRSGPTRHSVPPSWSVERFAEPGLCSSTLPTDRSLPRRLLRSASTYRQPGLGAELTLETCGAPASSVRGDAPGATLGAARGRSKATSQPEANTTSAVAAIRSE